MVYILYPMIFSGEFSLQVSPQVYAWGPSTMRTLNTGDS